MSAWLSVYCRETVADITCADLSQALDLPDPYLAAEAYGIEDDESVDAAMAQLRIESSAPEEFRTFSLYYHPAPSRPILIARRAPGKVVQEFVAEEVAERLASAKGLGAQRIRTHLAQVHEIVDFELGYEQLQDMGLVFSLACARYIAERGNGYLRDQDNVWWEVREGRWVRILPEN